MEIFLVQSFLGTGVRIQWVTMLAATSFPANFSLAVADNFVRLFALEYFFARQYLKTACVCKPRDDDRRSDEQLLNGHVPLMCFVETPGRAESKSGLEGAESSRVDGTVANF